jgi:ketosteroid isomerase-like protein
MNESTMEDQWAILNAYSRYEQAVPDQDYDTMASIFTEDAEIVNRLGAGKGRADIRNRFESRFVDAPITKIFAGNPIVEVDGDSARSSVDYLVLEVDPGSPRGIQVAQMGRYYDKWRKEDGSWLIYDRRASEPS